MTRPVALAMTIAVALAAFAIAQAAPAVGAPALTYGCSPPLPATAANCYSWHTGPVKIAWDWNQTLAVPVLAGTCSIQTVSQDTAGLPVSCEVQDLNDLSTTKLTAVIRIDSTPPTVTGIEPARSPDSDGWWNQPVAFTFEGTDATSGIADCDVVPYSGPDGAGAQVSGGCRDKAGNRSTQAFTVKYDASPPGLTDVTAKPGNRAVTVHWTASSDTVLSQLVRTPGVGGAPSSVLYGGTNTTFKDIAVTNGAAYRYTVTAYDAADNTASTTVSATPSLVYALAPAHNARLKRPPVLRWPAVTGARYYNVQLFRGKRKVLSAWPAGHSLRLHRSWSFGGRQFRLTPGRYRWFVWPGFGARAGRHYGPLIAQSAFSVRR
jgi:hypothetical protein